MASIVSSTEDHAYSSTESSVEREYEHILQVLLEGDNMVVTSLRQNKVYTLRDFFDLLKDSGKVNALKAKTKAGRFVKLKPSRIAELLAIPSFLMDLQNTYGTLSKSPYPIVTTTRNQFESFASRGIECFYDPVRAEQAQQRRDALLLSNTTTSPPINAPVVVGGPTPRAGSTALEAFNKKLSASPSRCPTLKNKSEWTQFSIGFTIECCLCDCEEVLNGTYQVPPGDVALDKRKQILVMSLLNSNVLSLEGKPIVRKHAMKKDARLCWQELVQIHEKDISGTNRAKHFFSLITGSRVPAMPKKPLCVYITEFEDWCTEHDTYCEPSLVISDQLRFQLFESYLTNVKELVSIEESLDIHDAQARSQGVPALSYSERIELYKRRATIHDEKFKVAVINERRRANMNLSVHVSEMELYDGYEEHQDTYVDDSYADEEWNVYAAAAGFGRRRGQVPKEVYDSFDPDVRRTWMSMPVDARERVITCLTKEPIDPTPSTPGTKPTNTPRSALRTPISRGSRANQAATSPPDDNGLIPTSAEADLVGVEVDDTVSASMGLVQAIASGPVAANQSALLPSDIHRMMSPQNKSPLVRQRIGASPSDAIPRLPRGSSTAGRTASTASLLTPDALRHLKQSQQDRHPTRRACFTSISHDDGLTLTDADEDTMDIVAASALLQDVAGLIDKGANGGLANKKQMRLLYHTEPPRRVNVTGVGDLNINGLRVGTFAARVRTQVGDIIIVCPEYGEMETGNTIHPVIQLKDGGCIVDDDPKALGGKQCITTPHGFVIPLDIKNGLPYMQMHYPSDDDLENLPHKVLTRDVPWDPRVYDLKQSDDEALYEQLAAEHSIAPTHENFNIYGEHMHANFSASIPPIGEQYILPQVVPLTGEYLPPPDPNNICSHFVEFYEGSCPRMHTTLYAHLAILSDLNFDASYSEQTLRPIEYEEYRKYFLNVPASTVRHTFDSTTLFYRNIPSSNHILNTFKSPYPALNVYRRHELVASDTVYADVPAWGGITAAQVFVGKLSQYVAVYGCKSDAEFASTLEDEIRKRGAMDKLVTDCAQAEISKKVKDILRALFIQDWQSEAYYHHQLFAERIIQELKKFANWVLNWSDAPPQAWYFVFEYVAFIMNRTAKEKLDVSILLHFTFWEPVFIKNYEGSGKHFPSESNEIIVRFVGFSETVGHSMTFLVFNESTQQLLHRSCLRKINKAVDVLNVPHYDPGTPDEQGDPDDAAIPEVIKIRGSDKANIRRTPSFSPSELIGRTFLLPPEDDGQRFRAKIIDYEEVSKKMEEFESDLEREPARVKFRIEVGDEKFQEYVEWDDLCDFIEEQVMNENGTWNFRKICGHKRDLKARETPQVLIQWESGEITFEPITSVYDADPYLLAEYARDNDLLDEWQKRCPRLKLKSKARNAKKMMRMINQAKLRSYREGPVYMYGYQVPRNHEEAVRLDVANGDTRWQDAEKLEKEQLFDYKCFEDRGHHSTARVPSDYKKIRLHFVYAVKHDGRFKARCVAGGHLTDTPTESVYAGVVPLRGVRLVIFLTELNGMEVWQTDVGNAYLEAYTTEKVYVIAGGEFGDKEGHVFIIKKALYGLKTSGKRWYERFSDVLREMGFRPSLAEPEIWMRACNPDGTVIRDADLSSEDPAFTFQGVSVPIFDGYYEYIAVYCYDLTIASMDPKAITEELKKKHNFKLKGSAPLNFLLGCDYYRDDDGTLCSEPKKYIAKMNSTYEALFGEPTRWRQSPLEPNDHPELDQTSLLDADKIKLYQSLVGAAQWVVSLGRFDIAVHVMTLSGFRTAPREGHLERMKRIYGYLCKFKNGAIRYRTDLPDYSDLKTVEYDWSRTVYAGAREEYPSNLPAARGEPVQMGTYVDANLYHDMLTGKAVTGILHLLNQTPFDWFAKKQATVETATFGSENSAARTAIEQMKANKLTLLYLGVPVIDRSVLFGDNKSVVDSTTQPHSKLHKRHLMLSYHYVREAIATGNYAYCLIDGKKNPADVLSKHWGYQSVWHLLRPILFWKGDTIDAMMPSDDDDQSSLQD